MKPFIALAASAPFLLLAGVGHAATFTFTDTNCSNFIIDPNGVISCASSSTATPASPPSCSVSAPTTAVVNSAVTISASCTPGPIIAYTWTGAPTVNGASTGMTFATAGSYTYTVKAENAAGIGGVSPAKTITVTDAAVQQPLVVGACPSGYVTPAGTSIINIGAKDFYANKDFDIVFDSAGSTFDSAVAGTETKAFKFTNTQYRTGFISGTGGNFGAGYKDFSLSVCPGDFSTSVPLACLKPKKLSANMYYSTDGSQGCMIPVNTPIYLNIRSNTSGTPAGFVLQNVIQTSLP